VKVYTRNHLEELNHPEDMRKIMAYLESHGTLHVNARTVENLYYDFSDTYAAGWLFVNDDRLEEFADWLENIDL
jgi:hypothetical protein